MSGWSWKSFISMFPQIRNISALLPRLVVELKILKNPIKLQQLNKYWIVNLNSGSGCLLGSCYQKKLGFYELRLFPKWRPRLSQPGHFRCWQILIGHRCSLLTAFDLVTDPQLLVVTKSGAPVILAGDKIILDWVAESLRALAGFSCGTSAIETRRESNQWLTKLILLATIQHE